MHPIILWGQLQSVSKGAQTSTRPASGNLSLISLANSQYPW